MTIIVVAGKTYSTSLIPEELGEHTMQSHDADATTADHDHSGNFNVDGALTASGLVTAAYAIVTPTLQCSSKIEVRDAASSACTTLRDGNSDLGSIVISNGTNTTFAVDKDGQVEAHNGIGAPILRADDRVEAPVINASTVIEVKDSVTGAATTLREGNSNDYPIEVGNGTNTTFICDKDGQVEAYMSFEAPILRGNSYISSPNITLGTKMFLKVPTSEEYYVDCRSVLDNTLHVFTVDADGAVICDSVGAGNVNTPSIIVQTPTITDGHMYINAPTDVATDKYIQCRKIGDNTVNVFVVDGAGEVECEACTAVSGMHVQNDGNFSWTHSSGNGLLRRFARWYTPPTNHRRCYAHIQSTVTPLATQALNHRRN